MISEFPLPTQKGSGLSHRELHLAADSREVHRRRKARCREGFLKWMMTDGQQSCEALSYAKLPKEVVAKEMKAIAQIQ